MSFVSFGKLLAAGRSWMGGEGVGRYRMRDNIRLPKFISPRNPFKPEQVTAPPSPPPPVAPEATATATGQSPRQKESVTIRVSRGLERAVLFCVDHNPFSRIGRRRLPALPRFGKRPVQGELSLDQVKVVRGDLVCADLEIVTAGAAGRSTGGPPWKNLGARIFGMGNQ